MTFSSASLMLAGSLFSATAGDLVLFDFTKDFASGKITVTDAKAAPASRRGAGLEVATGHAQSWPGITLPAPAGHWDLSPYGQVSLKLKNGGTNLVTIYCRVDNPGADGTDRCLTHSLSLNPGQADVLRVSLNHTHGDKLDGKLFGMRGYPASAGGPGAFDPRNVTQILVFVSRPQVDHAFEIQSIAATGSYVPPLAWTTDAAPFFPFIDPFGQYRHKDWPGKVKSLSDFQARRQSEAKELKRQPGPPDWDQYGGFRTGPKLAATGFFRTQKLKDKWWLVDPEGHLFFSHGIDCVRMLDATPIDDRRSWFADFPGDQPEFAAFRFPGHALMGYYAGRSPECFSFIEANLLRKYGPGWKTNYPPLVQQRLRSWGLNTIGNWSDAQTCRLRLTPYTDTIGSGHTRPIAGSEGYWGKFPDVFDPGFAEALARSMEAKRGGSAGDPWCLGYFSDNEMAWGDEVSLALAALQSPADQPAKAAFIADLKQKYATVEALNSAWGAHYASWDALAQNREAPNQTRAREDLQAFYTRTAEQYFKTVRDEIKTIAPHQLYLGCRFAWVNDRAAAAAAKYCDVVSYNLYRQSVAQFHFNGGADVPLLIGEFHFGALDRGLFHPGLVPEPDQKARAEAYRNYVLGALKHPQFVGCHWFQYYDEPTTGRVLDEENYQIGFVDVADTPYAETIDACRNVGYSLYR